MARRGKRIRIAPGIYADDGGLAAVVKIGTGSSLTSREKRFSPGTDLTTITIWQARTRATLLGTSTRPRLGTLAHDVVRYLALVRYLAGWTERRAELRAWVARLGSRRRDHLTRQDVLAARVAWLETGTAPKTINNRVQTLRHVYRTLDSTDEAIAITPCDRVPPLPVARTPIRRITDALVLRVDAQLQAHEACGWLRDPKTRARFRVLMATGRRPSEVGRAVPGDVDLDARIWIPRDGKGGFTPGIYLNDDMLAAWRFFVEHEAWGHFNNGNYVRVLRTAGWPAGLRPYQARHTFGMRLSEANVDLDDIGAMLGHKRRETTRKAYVPVLGSRLERASKLVDGRFGAWSGLPADRPLAITDPTTRRPRAVYGSRELMARQSGTSRK